MTYDPTLDSHRGQAYDQAIVRGDVTEMHYRRCYEDDPTEANNRGPLSMDEEQSSTWSTRRETSSLDSAKHATWSRRRTSSLQIPAMTQHSDLEVTNLCVIVRCTNNLNTLIL
jgi:hypothetical protein